MTRDIESIKRDLENKGNSDIIIKKEKLEKMFSEDPDIIEILGRKNKRPLNKYNDPNHPTKEELVKRNEIIEYNQKIERPQIIPYLKLNGINKEVLNFLMFDIADDDLLYYNDSIKNQILIVMCLVHEDDMETEYDIVRTDLLSCLVKDILNWSNALGPHLKCFYDMPDIIDSRYYCRTLKFKAESPNSSHSGMNNKYDRFRI
jgi:hypothetical protein